MRPLGHHEKELHQETSAGHGRQKLRALTRICSGRSDNLELSVVERIAGKEHCPITFRTRWRTRQVGGFAMLNWVVTLLIIALIAAVLGFGGIAGTAIGLAKLIFYVAVILFLVSLVFGYSRGGFRFPR